MTTTLPEKSVIAHASEPLHYHDATGLADLIATKQVPSREVVQAHLDRTAEVNPKINAIVTLMADDALRAADAADAAVSAGAELGPLHGVPVTIKDSIDTAGVLTQGGLKVFAGRIPDADGTSVARFKAAGGILLAKTNLPEFSAWTETDNLVTGRTNNPWNLDRTPGGSSGENPRPSRPACHRSGSAATSRSPCEARVRSPGSPPSRPPTAASPSPDTSRP